MTSITPFILGICLAATSLSEPPAELVEQNNRGVGLMGQFNFPEAVSIFDSLSQQFPDWPDVKLNLAIATLNRQQDGDEQRALELVREVLKADPENLRAHYCCGLLLLHAGQTSEAQEHFARVAEKDPTDGYAAYQYAQCLMQQQPQQAAEWFDKAIERDPYLRSSYYGVFQLLRQQRKMEQANARLEEFRKLEGNPRARVFEFKYTRMGPKAEAVVIGISRQAKPAAEGAVFADPIALLPDVSIRWQFEPGRGAITSCDINGDGRLDLFLTAVGQDKPNAVLFANEKGAYDLVEDHPLSAVTQVRAALWGDYDNDGLIDVYLCRQGPNQLWRQNPKGQWSDVTETTKTAGGEFDSVDGAMVDADHDGDLDLFVINADGPNELLNNNRDGSFSPIAAQQQIDEPMRKSKSVLFADLDNDRDLDIFVIHEEPPHTVFRNDRLWNYSRVENAQTLTDARLIAAVSADVDVDGRPEIYGLTSDGIARWSSGSDGQWNQETVAAGVIELSVTPVSRLAVADCDGDGVQELLVGTSKEILAVSLANPPVIPPTPPKSNVYLFAGISLALAALLLIFARGLRRPLMLAVAGLCLVLAGVLGYQHSMEISRKPPAPWTPLVQGMDAGPVWGLTSRDPATGPEIAFIDAEGKPGLLPAGTGRHKFATISLTGKDSQADSMRSNTSGIGATLHARVDQRWSSSLILRQDSGPGQSHLPVALGLAGQDTVDFVAIEWPDGIWQSELQLAAGKLHVIEETQRQTSSCPVLFVWDGQRYRFVTDLLGVGGLGFLIQPGEYVPPDPTENLLLPPGLLQPKQNRFHLKLTEPMEEVCYLDSARLVCYDLPPGWQMTLDERMHTGGPEPTGEPIFYREWVLPTMAVNNRGEDVTTAVVTVDRNAAPPGELDRRFIGRLASEHVLTLTFDRPLSDDKRLPVLIADGWIEYPYSQTMFAAWQAGASYEPPTIEAQTPDGEWTIVAPQFGYPAGMPRQMAMPLRYLPTGTTRLRIRTNQEIYWDRIAIAFAEECQQAVRSELPLQAAKLTEIGYPKRTDGIQGQPNYDYDQRRPLWDCTHLKGFYTQFGPVKDLVEAADDALAIFGPGEEVDLEFQADVPKLPTGWTRSFVLETVGWCKDRDLFTRDGDTVAPIPSRSEPTKTHRLNEEFNTRYRD